MSSARVRQQEHRVHAYMVNAFTNWLGRVNAAILNASYRLGILPDPTGLYQFVGNWQQEIVNLMPELETAAQIGWSEAFQQPAFSSTNGHVMNALQTSYNLLQNVPNEVHQMVIEDLTQGLSIGEPRAEIIDRINNTLSMTGTDRWRNRAAVIAMTETTRASNAGALAAAIQAQGTIGLLQKRWNDSKDHRVRETHQQIDGMEIPLMQPFVVGGFPLMYPSEPDGPPEEVVGCRCDLSFRRIVP